MGNIAFSFKCIVAAIWLAVGVSSPVLAQGATESERLDDLFQQLHDAKPEEVGRTRGQIVALWAKSGSAAMDLLFRRAEKAMEDGEPEIAVEHFTALIDHAPDFAEGYHGRATAYYQLGLFGPAMDDLRQTLVLVPRHFGAMQGIAVMLEEIDRPKEALEVWRKVAEFAPNDPDIAEVIDRLEVQLRGTVL